MKKTSRIRPGLRGQDEAIAWYIIAAVVVVIIVSIVAVAYIAFATSEGDDYIPTVQLTMTRTGSTTDRSISVEIDLEVDNPDFIDYFFGASVDPGFPSGKEELEVAIEYYYKSRQKVVEERTFHISIPRDKVTTWEIEFPKLRIPEDVGSNSFLLCGYVWLNNKQVGAGEWEVSPGSNTVTKV